jgi:hypothetical protein
MNGKCRESDTSSGEGGRKGDFARELIGEDSAACGGEARVEVGHLQHE